MEDNFIIVVCILLIIMIMVIGYVIPQYSVICLIIIGSAVISSLLTLLKAKINGDDLYKASRNHFTRS